MRRGGERVRERPRKKKGRERERQGKRRGDMEKKKIRYVVKEM